MNRRVRDGGRERVHEVGGIYFEGGAPAPWFKCLEFPSFPCCSGAIYSVR